MSAMLNATQLQQKLQQTFKIPLLSPLEFGVMKLCEILKADKRHTKPNPARHYRTRTVID